MPACAWLDARPAHSAAPSPQVVIGEQRGEGVRMGCRCFWDSDTDGYAEDTYRNVRTAHRASASRDPRLPAHRPSRAASLTAAPYARRIRSSASLRRLARTCTEACLTLEG